MSEIYISNGRIITGTEDFRGNLLIRDGTIAEISAGKIQISTHAKTIDATDRYILPGFIDPHVHMELPTAAGNSADDFRTGSLAALYGGTTTILDFVTPLQGQSLIEALHERKALAAGSLIDHSLHVSPLNGNPATIREIEKCIYNEGITSFKAYMA
ncbi:MAG: amidohydrolase family protein, partial [Bacteroidota bacterium]